MSVSRRRFLIGSAAVLAVGGGVSLLDPSLRTRASETVREYGDAHLGDHRTDSAIELTSGSFTSTARGGAEVGWSLAVPRDATAPLPLVVALHGRGGSHTSAFRTLDLDRALAEAVRLEGVPLALASVDGGDQGYYHRRADGTDAGVPLILELVHALGESAHLNGKLGLFGWSMGGFGALHIASTTSASGSTSGTSERARVSALAVSSAALWRRWRDSAPRAFDGPEDFAANDVLARSRALRSTPLRIVCGRTDPFIGTNKSLAKGLPHAEASFPAGAHTSVFWRSTNTDQIRFLARALSV